jgi:cation/acetate symporter
MRAPSHPRHASPHLGAYYGIIASAFVSLVICLAMFEQLGWQDTRLARTMMLAPLVLYRVRRAHAQRGGFLCLWPPRAFGL